MHRQTPEPHVSTEKGNVHLGDGSGCEKEVLPGLEPGLRESDKSESRVITTTL